MVKIEDITYRVGDFSLNVSLELEKEEYFVLFGQTGCGKTSLVECVCGLRDVESGRIVCDGEDITDLPPRERDVGYVPQDGALFEHLDVFHNIAFPLKVRHEKRREQRAAVESTAEKLHIKHLLDRSVRNLSGGERQRVAIARALVISPRVMLLDEPVSALDERTRDLVCRELVRIQRDAGIPVVHVCHSFEEARMVGDAMGVMRDGRLVQLGRPVEQLAEEPANAYVARLLGLQNVFTGRAFSQNGRRWVEMEDVTLEVPAPEGPVEFMIRPWQISLGSGNGRQDCNVVDGLVRKFSSFGAISRLQVDGDLPLTVHMPRARARNLDFKPGENVQLSFPPDAVHILSSD